MFIVRFQGGLANQLFQYAFYLKLTESFKESLIFVDISHYKKCKDHGGFKLENFVSMKYWDLEKNQKVIKVNELNYEELNFDISKDYYFDGYWQDKRFFPKNLTGIQNILNIQNILPTNRKYKEEIQESNSISVHVRRGDYIDNYMHGNIANSIYFQNSIEYLNSKIETPHYFVFSDDLEWCKKNIDFCGKKVTFIEGNSVNVEQDLILMSICKHNIISNSSFSWWAQFLNKNSNKLVITPEYWFNQATGSVNSLIVDDGITIPNTPFVNKVVHNPFFSIIIPVYNTSETLRRTLASVLNQTFTNLEVIIVDDGSVDNSYEILKIYEERDKRIRIFRHPENLGLLLSRITGMKQVKGKYIFFIDSDDWMELNTLEIVYDYCVNKNFDMLEFGYIEEPNKKVVLQKKVDDLLGCILCKNKQRYPVTVWNKVYSVDFIKKSLPYFNEFYCTSLEDGYFTVLFCSLAENYGYINIPFFHYVKNTGITNMSSYNIDKVRKIGLSYNEALIHIEAFIKLHKPDYLDLYNIFKNKELSILCNRFALHGGMNFEDRYNNLKCLAEIINDELIQEKLRNFIKDYNYLIKIYDRGIFKKIIFFCLFLVNYIKQNLIK